MKTNNVITFTMACFLVAWGILTIITSIWGPRDAGYAAVISTNIWLVGLLLFLSIREDKQ